MQVIWLCADTKWFHELKCIIQCVIPDGSSSMKILFKADDTYLSYL